MTGIFCPQTLTFDPIAIHLPVIMGDVEKKKILTTSQERSPVNPWHHLDVTVISQTRHILTSQMWDKLDVTVISQTPHMLTSQMWDNLDVTVISQTPHMLTSQKWCHRDVTGTSNKDVTVWHVCDIFLLDVETVLHATSITAHTLT